MSFTSKIKTEISNQKYNKLEQLTLLSALVKNDQNEQLILSNENRDVANLIFNLFEQNYKIVPKIIVRKGYNYNKNLIYIIEIKEKQNQIKKDLSIDTNIPKDYLISDDNLIRTYIKGVFLSKGSINDPKTSRYHLEIITPNIEYATFINKLLNNYNLNSKILKRETKYMVYIKESEKISDFLRLINATKALLYYEDIRIFRDHINMTNRLNNCEQANVDKIIQTATEQIKDIELIKKHGIDLLSEKEQLAATYRLKYPEASLQELSEIITIETNTTITKPGLHHRLTKIKNLAQKIREKETHND
ncbi:MAG: DNA-binding protein WhiA [Bacilli bacterium]|nr:DNA-binding protein WhiA [Bacilli bacterium]